MTERRTLMVADRVTPAEHAARQKKAAAGVSPSALLREAMAWTRTWTAPALEDVGLEVPRQGTNYITARDPNSGKRWRLKGDLYDRLGTAAYGSLGEVIRAV